MSEGSNQLHLFFYKDFSSTNTYLFIYDPHLRMFIGLRERERGRDQCERETSIGRLPYAPGLGIRSATQVCALPGMEPTVSGAWDGAPPNWTTWLGPNLHLWI